MVVVMPSVVEGAFVVVPFRLFDAFRAVTKLLLLEDSFFSFRRYLVIFRICW